MKALRKIYLTYLPVLFFLASLPLFAQQSGSTSKIITAKSSTKPPPKNPDNTKPKRPRVINDLRGFDLLDDPAKTKKQPMIAGATRGMPRPVALAPRLARLFTLYPTFQWNYRGEVKKFDFVLYDESHNEIYRTVVDGLELRYPDSAPSLKAEKNYFWTVEAAQSLLEGEPSATVGFVVMSDADRKHLDQAVASLGNSVSADIELAKARLLTDKRLWYDAISAYSDMISKHPQRAELYGERAQIYAQLGVTQKNADLDFLRAEEFGKAAASGKQARRPPLVNKR